MQKQEKNNIKNKKILISKTRKYTNINRKQRKYTNVNSKNKKIPISNTRKYYSQKPENTK